MNRFVAGLLASAACSLVLEVQAFEGLWNPERGFRFEQWIGLEEGEQCPRYIPDNWPVECYRTTDAVSVAQAYCYLMKYWETDEIPAVKLAVLQRDFDRARKDGIKFLLRFAYESDSFRQDGKAPTLERLLGHIRQLTPIVRKNLDVIYCLQIGWLGLWGEFHTNPLCYDPKACAAVVKGTLEMLPSERFTMMRRMKYKVSALDVLGDARELTAVTAFTSAPHARIGFFNDGTLAYHNDGGTFTEAKFAWPGNAEFDRVTRESAFMPVDGELFWNSEPDSITANGLRAIERFRRHHYTTFSLVHGNSELDRMAPPGQTAPIKGPIDAWKAMPVTAEMLLAHGIPPDEDYFRRYPAPTAFEYIRDHLGYRLNLVSADAEKVVLRNTGFSRPINPRKAWFVRVLDTGEVTEFATDVDCRVFEPEKDVTVTIPPAARAAAGRLALWLPDAAETLRRCPDFAIAVAGADVKVVDGRRLNFLWVQATGTSLSLVPAPREFTAGKGAYAVEPKVKYTLVDWYDFDRVGQAFAEMKKTVTTDDTLPKEGYRLKVTKAGVEIAAADAAGEFYALQTLRQLAVADGTNSVSISCCEVKDWPAYRWRGFLVDEGRHFLGKEIVLKILDTMAAHKLNVLHWHLTEDQGWRLELKRHPELVEYGAKRRCSVRFGTHSTWKPPTYKMGQSLNADAYGPYYYTQDDVREILAYAKARHITVVPEIELPGHVRALLAAHPELICEGQTHGREPAVEWGVQKEVLCVGNDAALKLYEEIFDEVCELFPDTPFVHIGGDECPRDNWKACPKCQSRMKAEGLKDESGLQAWITSKVVRYLEKKGCRAVGWDEILAGDVPTSAVGMVWRADAKGGAGTAYVSAAEAVRRGHDMVMAPNTSCYLNYMQGLLHDPYPYYSPWPTKDPLTLKKAYDYDPARDIPSEFRHHILGGQISVWGESTFNVFDLEWKAWPRGCAIAEVLWLGDAKPGFEDFRRRMEAHRIWLLDNHVNCAPLE